MIFRTDKEEQTRALGRLLSKELRAVQKDSPFSAAKPIQVALHGSSGHGKTTFVSGATGISKKTADDIKWWSCTKTHPFKTSHPRTVYYYYDFGIKLIERTPELDLMSIESPTYLTEFMTPRAPHLSFHKQGMAFWEHTNELVLAKSQALILVCRKGDKSERGFRDFIRNNNKAISEINKTSFKEAEAKEAKSIVAQLKKANKEAGRLIRITKKGSNPFTHATAIYPLSDEPCIKKALARVSQKASSMGVPRL